MSYKSILVHVDTSPHAAERFKVAADFAIAHDAHLIGAAMVGISRFVYMDTGVDLAKTIIAAEIEELEKHAQQALAQFQATCVARGVLSYEQRIVNDDPAGGLALQARYVDLVVLSQVDRDDAIAVTVSDLPEYVMLNGARPVLMVPYAGQFEQVGANILVAWNTSMEATRAVTSALPQLRRAAKVTVAIFDPAEADGPQPGTDIALYLARHGVSVEVDEQHATTDIGNAVLSLAADLHTDLIVMGGYGHTRFRELLLGGVTATMLKTMTVPVLMSH